MFPSGTYLKRIVGSEVEFELKEKTLFLEWLSSPVPADHWEDGPYQSEGPDKKDSQYGSLVGHRLSSETL